MIHGEQNSGREGLNGPRSQWARVRHNVLVLWAPFSEYRLLVGAHDPDGR